jgi:predicted TIM-barrel fold metal-dependent hydrolase
MTDWERIAQREDFFRAEVSSSVHRWASAEDVLFAMDADGIGESWICGFGFTDMGLCRICNDYVIECALSSGGRLKPLVVVPPLAPGALSEIARCTSLGAIGVGEILPDGQRFNIDSARETWRFAAVCHECGLFVLMHVAEPLGRDYPGKGSAGPREAYEFARNHPELRVVMAHFGGGLFLYEQMQDVRVVLRNVWYDTAAAPFLYSSSIFASALASGAGNKFVYGSDFPILRYPRYKRMINEAAVAGDELDGLLSRNATRLLSEP